jgi:ferredoxin
MSTACVPPALYINPDFCIDCGACEPVCPQGAIYLDGNVPTELSVYTEINSAAYESGEFGPGNATDHPFVAALPPRRATQP